MSKWTCEITFPSEGWSLSYSLSLSDLNHPYYHFTSSVSEASFVDLGKSVILHVKVSVRCALAQLFRLLCISNIEYLIA